MTRAVCESRVPGIQNAFDRLPGFSSALPGVTTSPGTFPATEDSRLEWLATQCPVDGMRVLECGPLECGHSYFLQHRGVASVVAVENNWNCFVKCLVVKEAFGLDRVSVLFGDVVKHAARAPPGSFDLCICSGVLYHLTNPVELIKHLGTVCDRLLIWTHVYDPSVSGVSQDLEPQVLEFEGRRYAGATQRYPDGGVEGMLYCGGSRPISFWIAYDSLCDALRHYGFRTITKNEELSQSDHPNGPAVTLYCEK